MKGKSILSFFAYLAVAFIAVSLVLGNLLGWLINPQILYVLNLLAQIIAYSIVAIYAFMFAKSKKHIAWTITYFVFLVIIIVFMVLTNI